MKEDKSNHTPEVEILRPHPTEAIVLKFGEISYDEARKIFNTVKSQFPENTIIAIPDYVSLQSCSKDTLENIISMIAEIINTL